MSLRCHKCGADTKEGGEFSVIVALEGIADVVIRDGQITLSAMYDHLGGYDHLLAVRVRPTLRCSQCGWAWKTSREIVLP